MTRGVECGAWGVGCGVWGVGFRVWGVGCGVWSVGCGVWGVGCGVRGAGCRVGRDGDGDAVVEKVARFLGPGEHIRQRQHLQEGPH